MPASRVFLFAIALLLLLGGLGLSAETGARDPLAIIAFTFGALTLLGALFWRKS